jgi:hypothetical protein
VVCPVQINRMFLVLNAIVVGKCKLPTTNS